ncbi:LSM domain-containing protein [Cryptosporidium andersoni]|uniref:LSM domain-containing protein n=1 Tax=Cryptosporidium andersoni TaxID=117008 RepID=A0A1J4MS83_9CRYT|nr:LSM domain-containing protein [Cryptosporidium andersoni]
MPISSSLITEPIDLIRLSLDEKVNVKCRGDRELEGILYAYDPHMNMVLGNVKETSQKITIDEVTGEESTIKVTRRIEMLFLRGDLIILVKPAINIGIIKA